MGLRMSPTWTLRRPWPAEKRTRISRDLRLPREGELDQGSGGGELPPDRESKIRSAVEYPQGVHATGVVEIARWPVTCDSAGTSTSGHSSQSCACTKSSWIYLIYYLDEKIYSGNQCLPLRMVRLRRPPPTNTHQARGRAMDQRSVRWRVRARMSQSQQLPLARALRSEHQ
jgi:hypothetical protein